MALLLVGRLAAVAVRFLIGSVADDALDALIARGDGQILEVAHRVHVLDLSACQAAFLGTPLG
eukprot:9683356-Ditylum_brightwellii.AAC.1